MNFHAELDGLLKDINQYQLARLHPPMGTRSLRFTQEILRDFMFPLIPMELIRLYSICDGFSGHLMNVFSLAGNLNRKMEGDYLDIFSMCIRYSGSNGNHPCSKLYFGNSDDCIYFYDADEQQWVCADHATQEVIYQYPALFDVLSVSFVL